jgi:hypothetical protein
MSTGRALSFLVELSAAASPGWRPLAQAIQAFATNNRRIWLVATLIALTHAMMAITATEEESPTFDEPVHLTAGYSYWLKNDFRLDPENGNLSQRWAALPLLITRPNFIPLVDRGWQRAEEGRTGHQFFYERGNDSDRMLRQSRMMMSLVSAALCLLIFRCSREFFGVAGGLLSETLAAFDPTMLAHGALVTSDVASAFLFTAAAWTFWQLSHKITVRTFAFAALGASALFLTKFSAILFLPIAAILFALRIGSRTPIELQIARWHRVFGDKWSKSLAIIASGVGLGLIAFVAIWASFAFRYSAWTDGRSAHKWTAWHWNYLLADQDVFANTVAFARQHKVLPEAYLYGLAFVHKHEIDRPAFLDNHWSIVGFRSFFPRAFLYKTPLPILGLLALGLIAAIARWRKKGNLSERAAWRAAATDVTRLSPFWTVALVYGAFAIGSHLNIGHRHILPIYPAVFILCGASVRFTQRKAATVGVSAAAILLLWQVGESVAIRPNYLAYFNELTGGPGRGREHLVDSSLDWGQDLPGLKAWLETHQSVTQHKPLYLAYFGTGDPRWYGIEAQSLPYDPLRVTTTPSLLKGGIYCISATTLQQVYSREMGPWCAPYEQHYRMLLFRIGRRTVPNPSAADPQRTANPGDARSRARVLAVRELENMRLARLCAYLRHRKPLTQIGYSILVFDLGDEEVHRALYGPPTELAPAISVAGY